MQTFAYAGHTLTWEEHSSGEHTLLFIHGWSVGRSTWKPVIERMTHLGRCVTLDLPGHYPATVPPNYHLTQEDLIDLEAHAIEHISQGRPVTLIGHSAGGLVSLGVANRMPHLVDSIISINSVVWGEFRGIVQTTLWLLRNGMYPAVETIWDLTLQDPWSLMNGLSFFVHRQDDFWNNNLAWRVCNEVHQWYHLHSLRDLCVFLHMLDTCDIRSLITTLPVPVLVVVGEHDPVLPPKQSYWLADNLPNVDLCIFERTGHIPQVEAPVTFERVISEWLRTHHA